MMGPDIVLVYECLGSHISESSFAMPLFFPHRTQSLRIHILLFSIDFLLVTPIETNHLRILFASFVIMKSQNSAATFVTS